MFFYALTVARWSPIAAKLATAHYYTFGLEGNALTSTFGRTNYVLSVDERVRQDADLSPSFPVLAVLHPGKKLSIGEIRFHKPLIPGKNSTRQVDVAQI